MSETQESKPRHDEPTLATRRIHEGRMINMREDTVLLPSGREGRREIVEHKGAACMVPVLPDGRVVVVRQYRKAAESALLEIPAGGLNVGEDPAECARRELAEECNLAGDITPMFSCFLAPGYSTELIHCFLITNCQSASGTPDEDENLIIEVHHLEALMDMIDRGDIRDAKTLSGLLWLYRHRLENRSG